VRALPLLLALPLCVATNYYAPPPKAFVPAQGPSYDPSQALLVEIRDELRGLRQDVRGLQAVHQPQQDGALAVVAKRCVSCHQSPADKGDGFVIVEADGKLAELSPGYQRSIVRAVSKGTMPPSGKLPDAEVKLLTEYFAPKEATR
jgi:mono/diheme cytochrome c family protein